MMGLKHALLSALSLATATQAAITFYGSDGAAGDILKCGGGTNNTDTSLALSFSIIYPGHVAKNSTTFRFDDPIVCGDEASLSIEFNCNDLGAHSTCIPKKSIALRVHQSSRSKRGGGAKCDPYSGQCRNQYQSTSGYCSSEYSKEHVLVSGYTQDIWCVKPCTEEEASSCLSDVCNRVRPHCESSRPSEDSCEEALIECRGTPVKLKQEWCKPELFGGTLFGGSFAGFCGQQKQKCLEYANGACRLDTHSWDEYVSNADVARLNAANAYAAPGPLPE